MPNVTTAPKSTQANAGCGSEVCGLPEIRTHPFSSVDDYGIALPEWLKDCIKHIPPGLGQSCPIDSEALLAAAFDLAFQL
ncbi:MAG: (p)ppGpp synthetase, partial [Cyanobacteriota bacterium]|nr:(p)ppGpp synthetase [Cyanobacteriota bacterium]